MFEVTCLDAYGEIVNSFTQWDINQTLTVRDSGLTVAPAFHFCNKNSKEALVVVSTMDENGVLTVKVPNILLTEATPIIAYIYAYINITSAKTLATIRIPVEKRAKPSEYEYVENIDMVSAIAIEQEVNSRIADLIKDDSIVTTSTWSSDKINDLIVTLQNNKLDVSDLINLIQDNSMAATSTWSSDKINNMITTVQDNKLSASDFTLSNITGILPISKGGTNAIDRGNALKNISFETYTCTTLSQDGTYYTDLDNIKTSGVYYIQRPNNSTANITTMDITDGWLVVIPSDNNGTKQILYRYGSTTTHHQIFVRTCFTNTWSGWVRIFSSADTIPIENGGTGATNKFSAMANLAYNVVSSSDSTNLNAYTAQTVSVFSSEVPATANLPSGSNGVGMLAAITADRADLSQIWIGMTSGEVSLFTRTRVGGTWSSWEKVYTTQDDLPTANLVVTGIATDVSNSVVFRRAGVTYLTGYVIATPTSTTATTVTLGYVPESYRGTINANVTAYNATENTTHQCTIYAGGSIRVSNVVKTSNSTQTFYINAMWI